MNITIQWLHDYHDCETCGTTYAEGAQVYFDSALVLDLQPVAGCCGSDHYSQEDVYSRILKHLGHTVEEV